MSAFLCRANRLVHRSLLRSASLLVPAGQRVEWLREWRGELWHVRRSCADEGSFSLRNERQIAAFCLGAFPDALCLRRAGQPQGPASAGLNGTARQCLLILVALAAASYGLALLLPGVSAERSLWQRKVNPGLVLIAQAGSGSGRQPTIAPAQLRSWEQRKQQFFDGFAFYRVMREPARPVLHTVGSGSATSPWRVAHASPNLFTLLGLPIYFAGPDATSRPDMARAGDLAAVILSETAWKREFGADTRIAGTAILLGAHQVRIAGVTPDASLGLPGGVDAWVLDPEVSLTADAGYVVAHLTAPGEEEMWTSCVHVTANAPDGAEDDLLAVALQPRKPGPVTLFLFATFLALLALPAITTVYLGEASVNPHRTSWLKRLHQWSFLFAKIALLVPTIYFVSLDLAYGWTAIAPERAAYLQLLFTFGGCLFGMRWVLKDQRQRCPVCMRTVTHPAQVGVASRTFLDWNGTEMMCMGGHTLLHVPSLPTSWFSAQRWLYLDTSWNFLFAQSSRQIP